MIKKLIYLSIPASLIAASVLSISFDYFQLSLFRIIILTVFLLMFVQILIKNTIFNIFKNRYNSYSIKTMVIWLLYAIFSLAWVKDDVSWLKAVYFLTLGVICIVVISYYLTDSRSILTAFNLIAVMAIFHNLIGWYEIVTGNYMFLKDSQAVYARYSYPVSMFDNTNNFALFMLVSIFVSYVCAMNAKTRIMQIINALLLISSMYLLVMTNSRANILGMIIAFSFFVLIQMKDRRMRRFVLIATAAAVLLIVLKPEIIMRLFAFIDNNLFQRFAQETGSDATRIGLIKNGLMFLALTFGFGTGAGNIEYWIENYSAFNTGSITSMHNWWLEILTGYGVVIFALYLLFYLKLFKSISLAILCFLIGFVIGSISASSNIGVEWLWVFWGIIIAYQGVAGNRIFSDAKQITGVGI
ncbi:MAG: O-antigen ligase family protein [Saccharofermentanales bacterium]